MRTKEMNHLIKTLPKVDLHVHLDGSIKPQTVIDLAQNQGITIPQYTVDQIQPYLQISQDCKNLSEYLSKFELPLQVLQTKEALERVAFEMVEQAQDQNCKYIEVRFGPQLHLEKGLSLEQVIAAVIDGLNRGEARFGVKSRAIVCCLRHHSVKTNLKVVDVAASFLGYGLAGVDLAGDEASFPPHLFRDVYSYAHKRAIPITIHAGEAAGPESVKEAISRLGACRIGHGVQLYKDKKLLKEVIDKDIPLEMCPVSNIQTKASPSWSDYPIRQFVNAGLNVTVNTDNLTVSNTTITNEFQTLVDKFDFTFMEIKQIIVNGIQAAFLEAGEKQKLESEIVKEFDKKVTTSTSMINII